MIQCFSEFQSQLDGTKLSVFLYKSNIPVPSFLLFNLYDIIFNMFLKRNFVAKMWFIDWVWVPVTFYSLWFLPWGKTIVYFWGHYLYWLQFIQPKLYLNFDKNSFPLIFSKNKFYHMQLELLLTLFCAENFLPIILIMNWRKSKKLQIIL